MTVASAVRPSTLTAMLRGAMGVCPNCGNGLLYRRYLKPVEHCAACGEAYAHLRADDAAPWLTILVVGHIVVPLLLLVHQSFEPPMWLELAVWLPLTLALTLYLLPRCKGIILALIWALRAEGSERG